MLVLRPYVDIFVDYVRQKKDQAYARIRTALALGKAKEAYPLLVEPWSRLFCKGGAVTINDIENEQEPTRSIVHFEVDGVWTDEALAMQAELRDLGVDWTEVDIRGGGAGQTLSNVTKTLPKMEDNVPQIQECQQFFKEDEWREGGNPCLHQIIQMHGDKTKENGQMLKADSSLMLVGKEEDTGTGWLGDLSKRGTAAAAIKRAPDYVVDQVCLPLMLQFVEDYQRGIDLGPDQGVDLETRGQYKTTQAGERIDPDYDRSGIVWQTVTIQNGPYKGKSVEVPLKMRGTSKARAVLAGVCGMFHGPGLDSAQWSRNLKERVKHRRQIMLYDKAKFAWGITRKPAIAPHTEDEMVLISLDYGGCQHPAFKQGDRMIVPDPGWSMSADIVYLSWMNIVAYTNEGMRIAKEYGSGHDWTMDGYLAKDYTICLWADKMGIPDNEFYVIGVGDDTHIVCAGRWVGPFLAKWGKYFKAKGMKVVTGLDGSTLYTNFILGSFFIWKNGGGKWILIAYTSPRFIKTETSVKAIGKPGYVANAKLGETYSSDIPMTDEELKQYTQLWTEYRELIIWHGDPEEYRDILERKYWEGKLLMSQFAGVSFWMKENEEQLGLGTGMEMLERKGPTPAPKEDVILTEQRTEPAASNVFKKETETVGRGMFLISGMPGSGKTALSKLYRSQGSFSLDLDKYGEWVHGADGQQHWVILTRGVRDILDQHNLIGTAIYAFGLGDNLERNIQYIRESNLASLKTQPHDEEAITKLPWTRKILLTYEPNDAEREKRFGSERDNMYGKGDGDWEQIKAHIKGMPIAEFQARGWVVIDTTGKDLDAVRHEIDSLVSSSQKPDSIKEEAKNEGTAQAEVGTKSKADASPAPGSGAGTNDSASSTINQPNTNGTVKEGSNAAVGETNAGQEKIPLEQQGTKPADLAHVR